MQSQLSELLYFVGRNTLIKFVVSDIPLYSMATIKFLVIVSIELDKILRRF